MDNTNTTTKTRIDYGFKPEEFETVRKTVDEMALKHGVIRTRDYFLIHATNESGRRRVLFEHGLKRIQRAAARLGA